MRRARASSLLVTGVVVAPGTVVDPPIDSYEARKDDEPAGADVADLDALAGARLRLGIKALIGSEVLPFALAPAGDRVAAHAHLVPARSHRAAFTGRVVQDGSWEAR